MVAGLREVAARGLVYDLLILPHQLGSATVASRQVPHCRFVVDHAAKPGIAAREWEPWATSLRALAAEPNVSCKLSGLVTEADWGSWSIADLQPYADHVLALFGPSRLLFGTDWPVCTLAASYQAVVGAAEELVASLSDDERGAVFGGTATDVYRLHHRSTAGAGVGAEPS